MEIPEKTKNNLFKALLVFIVVLCLFYAVRFLSEFRSYRMMGDRNNVITVTGHGEVSAVPDIANISFTIHKEGKAVKEAQDAVAVVEKQALDLLKTMKIEDKDIKASNASFSPKYEYVYSKTACMMTYCPPGKNVITGYESFETITVKVRNTDDLGKLVQELSKLSIESLDGPNFAVDQQDDLKAEARKQAIEDAKAKAKVLAKDLGVSIKTITSFSESSYPMPMYYSKAGMMDYAVESSAPAEIPKGENLITSDVTITYEIR